MNNNIPKKLIKKYDIPNQQKDTSLLHDIAIMKRYLRNSIHCGSRLSGAMQNAVLALKKQVRRKPREVYKNAFGTGDRGVCECGEMLLVRHRYCPNCGQALDLSDDEQNKD